MQIGRIEGQAVIELPVVATTSHDGHAAGDLGAISEVRADVDEPRDVAMAHEVQAQQHKGDRCDHGEPGDGDRRVEEHRDAEQPLRGRLTSRDHAGQ